MARSTTPILTYQNAASALTGLMLLRVCAVHGLIRFQSAIKQYVSCLVLSAGGYWFFRLNMLTGMPYRLIGFTKCGSHANTSGDGVWRSTT